MHGRPQNHRVARRTVALCATLAMMGGPGWAVEPCTGYTAQLEGTNTIAMGGVTMTSIQRMVLRKRDGGGIAGNWTGIEHEQVSHNSLAMLPEAIAALKSVPVQVVPGVKATCETTVLDAHTYRVRCVGEYPFEIKPNGGIFWRGKSTLIGTVASTTASPPVGITLDLLMGAPGYAEQTVVDGTMTGTIHGPGQFGFVPVVSNNGYAASPDPYSEIQVDIRTAPEHDDAAISLAATARYTGPGEAPFWAVNTERNHVRLNARLHGDPAKRAALAGDTTITATAVIDDCEMRQSWPLIDLALKDGVGP